MRLVVAQTWDGVPVGADEAVALELHLDGDSLVVDVAAPFHGDVAPGAAVGSTDRLWEHEVVELFVAGPGESYAEIELGPFGHFLVLRLKGVRNLESAHHAIAFAAERHAGRWMGRARIRRALLPPGPWRVNAYAIHGISERRYLVHTALQTQTPDFHLPDRFVVVYDPRGL